MHCFYVDTLEAETIVLDEQESAHCARVLRLVEGESVLLTNGEGVVAQGVLTAVGRRDVRVEVAQRNCIPRRRGQQTILAVAPTKNADRMEWLVEKATEVGCGVVVPLQCARGVRGRLNGERLRRVAVSALKQSQGAYLPKIYPMIDFSDFFSQLPSMEMAMSGFKKSDTTYLRAVAHCAEGERRELRDLLRAEATSPLVVLVGPEGDFSPEEIALARAQDFQPVSLGSARLRTETAALVATVLASD